MMRAERKRAIHIHSTLRFRQRIDGSIETKVLDSLLESLKGFAQDGKYSKPLNKREMWPSFVHKDANTRVLLFHWNGGPAYAFYCCRDKEIKTFSRDNWRLRLDASKEWEKWYEETEKILPAWSHQDNKKSS